MIMIIEDVKIQHQTVISTSVGVFRVDIEGNVEFDQEQPHGYYQFVFVHPENISDFELTRDEYIQLQRTGIDEILLALKSKGE